MILLISLIAQNMLGRGNILSYGDREDIYEYTHVAVRLFDFYYWIATSIISRTLNAKVLN